MKEVEQEVSSDERARQISGVRGLTEWCKTGGGIASESDGSRRQIRVCTTVHPGRGHFEVDVGGGLEG